MDLKVERETGTPPSKSTADCPEAPRTGQAPMKRDNSSHLLVNFNEGHGSQGRPADSEPGLDCESQESDRSMTTGQFFAADLNRASGERGDDHSSRSTDSIFKRLQEEIFTFVQKELEMLRDVLNTDKPECFETVRDQDAEQRSSSEAFITITLNFLMKMQQKDLAERLWSRSRAGVLQRKLKTELQRKCQCVFEGVAKAGNPALLQQIFTELYITEGGATGVNQEHEIRTLETASRKPDQPETAIRCEDIFKGPADTKAPIRTVLTKGVAGIGKTLLTQKFSLDWAEDKTNHDVQLLFPFTFRALNVLKDRHFSLVQLLHQFFSGTKQLCGLKDLQVLFIFDGLDECRLSLDFTKAKALTEPTESAPVEELLVNLIRGSLLPSARLWITTRPAAANQIPAECVSVVTEVRGFTDLQKEKYFRKRFKDEAHIIISHIKMSRSLHIMCYIPLFCWILSTVLELLLKTAPKDPLPKTLTEMYIYFLVVQAKVKNIKYEGGSATDSWSAETRKMVQSLGKLAFEQLQKGNLIFYESDLSKCGLDTAAASVYSGVFTQVFREESALYQNRVYCFVHLSVQEFLAALHVHQTFVSNGINLLLGPKSRRSSLKRKLKYLHHTAIDQALESPNGHLDMFLRFLLGLSLPINQSLLPSLLTQTESSSKACPKTADYIKHKLSGQVSTERRINLFHCLNELNDHSLEEQIQHYLNSGPLSEDGLSPDQWSTLTFILLSSEEDLNQFELRKYLPSDEALLKLLSVVSASKRALLSSCHLSERSCEALSSVLDSSSLRVLDLSDNDLKDSGTKMLSDGLKSPRCKLEELRMSGCLISEKGCDSLASALRSNPSHLKSLDLSYNHLGDRGAELLSTVQRDPQCSLTALRLEPSGPHCLSPGPRRYFTRFTLDPDTADRRLQLSDNNSRVACAKQEEEPSGQGGANDWYHISCTSGLTGRCYWEVQWSGAVYISVSGGGIGRGGVQSRLGGNECWGLDCSEGGFSVYHENKRTRLPRPWSAPSGTVAVHVDSAAGALTFYTVSPDELIRLHTIRTTFTNTLVPGFWMKSNSSVFLSEARV